MSVALTRKAGPRQPAETLRRDLLEEGRRVLQPPTRSQPVDLLVEPRRFPAEFPFGDRRTVDDEPFGEDLQVG